MIIIGLDVSTSCVGIAAINELRQPLLVGAITLNHIEHVKDKASAILDVFVKHILPLGHPDKIIVEQSLQAFRPGLSSANTICSLVKMNGVTSVLTEMLTQSEISYISSQTARKLCGIKIIKGLDTKTQVCDWALKNVLSSWTIPQKQRSADMANQVKDAVDALVVAIGGLTLIEQNAGVVSQEKHAECQHNINTTEIFRKSVGSDHCVKIWKGSVCKMSLSIVSNSQ
jgi:hypothetical protein